MKRLSYFAGLVSTLVIGFSAVSTVAAANPVCYDFATLSGSYHVGDVFVAPQAEIRLKEYLFNGLPHVAGVAYADTFAIVNSSPPQFKLYVINARVVPNVPLRSVTLKFGEIVSAGSPHNNIEVNGELREVAESLTSLNGETLGPVGHKAAVIVNLDPGQVAGKNTGTLEVHAVSGTIDTFSIGGIQLFVDDVYMEQ